MNRSVPSRACSFTPRFLFFVRGDGLIYIENFGYAAWCMKVGKLVASDRVEIQDTRITTRMWQGRLVRMELHDESDVPAAWRMMGSLGEHPWRRSVYR